MKTNMRNDLETSEKIKNIWNNTPRKTAEMFMLYQALRYQNFNDKVLSSIHDKIKENNDGFKGINKIYLSRNLIGHIYKILSENNDPSCKVLKKIKTGESCIFLIKNENSDLLIFLQKIYELSSDLLCNVLYDLSIYYINLFQKSNRYKFYNFHSYKDKWSSFREMMKQYLKKGEKSFSNNYCSMGIIKISSYQQFMLLLNSRKDMINLLSKSYMKKVGDNNLGLKNNFHREALLKNLCYMLNYTTNKNVIKSEEFKKLYQLQCYDVHFIFSTLIHFLNK